MVRWQQKRQNLFVFFLLRPVLSLHSFVAFLYTATKLIYSSVYAVLKLIWDFVSRKFVFRASLIRLGISHQMRSSQKDLKVFLSFHSSIPKIPGAGQAPGNDYYFCVIYFPKTKRTKKTCRIFTDLSLSVRVGSKILRVCSYRYSIFHMLLSRCSYPHFYPRFPQRPIPILILKKLMP